MHTLAVAGKNVVWIFCIRLLRVVVEPGRRSNYGIFKKFDKLDLRCFT
jgi:hypothetical protein